MKIKVDERNNVVIGHGIVSGISVGVPTFNTDALISNGEDVYVGEILQSVMDVSGAGYTVKAVCKKGDIFNPEIGKEIVERKGKLREARIRQKQHAVIVSRLKNIVNSLNAIIQNETRIVEGMDWKCQNLEYALDDALKKVNAVD